LELVYECNEINEMLQTMNKLHFQEILLVKSIATAELKEGIHFLMRRHFLNSASSLALS